MVTFKVGDKVRHKSANVEWWWQYFCKANKCSPTGVYTVTELGDHDGIYLSMDNGRWRWDAGMYELVVPKKKRKVI